MRNRGIVLLLVSLVMYVGHARGAFNEEEWRKTYDHPKVKAAVERWLTPGQNLEKFAREKASREGTLPKDPARAEKYISEYVAFMSSFYATIYKGTKIDSQLARQVLENPDFSEDDVKRDACLLLYIDSGDVSYLKRYLLSNEYSPKLFLRVHDPAVVPVALEIIGEAYKNRLDHWSTPDQKQSVKIVAAALPAFAGMMYVQDGGNLQVAKLLFRDASLFSPALGMRGFYAFPEISMTLYREAPRSALEDFLYAVYEKCDSQALGNIKMNAEKNNTPELAEIEDKVGERYRSDCQKMFEQIKAAKSQSPAQPNGGAK